MKYLGLIMMAIGLSLLAFVFFNFLKEKNKVVSPIPEEKGVKVIFITPANK